MIEFKTGDLLDVQSGIIVHGCNTRGVMGGGVALAVKNKYPECFAQYKEFLQMYHYPTDALGDVHFYRVNSDLIIANAFTQKRLGFDEDGNPPASYRAIEICFAEIAATARRKKMPVHFPRIGAGLGGLDWNEVLPILEHQMKDLNSTCWTL